MSSIKRYTIYGERSSGTNYLQQIMDINFDVELTWDFGWKHFFGFVEQNNSDDTLFICIVRNFHDWINSFYKHKHHLIKDKYANTKDFLNNEFYSNPDTWSCKEYYGENYHILGQDLNIFTHQRYKNIFELRHTKLKYLIDVLPKKVDNYILIKYEDLILNFKDTLNKIKNMGLVVKNSNFPVNTNKYSGPHKNRNGGIWKPRNKNEYEISLDDIYLHNSFCIEYEKSLGYCLDIDYNNKVLNNRISYIQKNLFIEKKKSKELEEKNKYLKQILKKDVNRLLLETQNQLKEEIYELHNKNNELEEKIYKLENIARDLSYENNSLKKKLNS